MANGRRNKTLAECGTSDWDGKREKMCHVLVEIGVQLHAGVSGYVRTCVCVHVARFIRFGFGLFGLIVWSAVYECRLCVQVNFTLYFSYTLLRKPLLLLLLCVFFFSHHVYFH